MIRIRKKNNTIFMEASGELTEGDYDKMLPALQQMMDKHDQVNWYLEFNDFKGWSTHAFWRDISFTLSNRLSFDKVAIVGENKWQEAMVEVMELFSATHIEYFDKENSDSAKQWIRS